MHLPQLQGRGYEKRIIEIVFNQANMVNKWIYAIIRLPCGYELTEIIKTEEDKDTN